MQWHLTCRKIRSNTIFPPGITFLSIFPTSSHTYMYLHRCALLSLSGIILNAWSFVLTRYKEISNLLTTLLIRRELKLLPLSVKEPIYA